MARQEGCKKPPFLRSPPLFGKCQRDKAYALTARVVQLLTSPFILRILTAERCGYDTTLSVCHPGSLRTQSNSRAPSSVQGTPRPRLPAPPQAPAERPRTLGVMTTDHAHYACALERTRSCEY